jgi:hypothetical protein
MTNAIAYCADDLIGAVISKRHLEALPYQNVFIKEVA